ncbi:MAG TPA: site-specific integrase [Clostridia bacterium]|nr:site-specific integrase [Clostridia bacterium]
MKGRVVKKSKNTWLILIEAGKDPKTGKRRRIKRTVTGKKEQAEEEMRKLLSDVERGTYVEPSKVSVAEYLQYWLENYCKQNLAPSTFLRYRLSVRHLLPEIGSIPLHKLHAWHVQECWTRLLEEGAEGGRGPLSTRSVQHDHRVLHEALEHALKWGLIPKNPLDGVECPRYERPEAKFLMPDEVKKLLDAADPFMRAFVLTVACTGLRAGEALGLQWKDIDFKENRIFVSRALQKLPGQDYSLREPKTKKSRRAVVIPPELTEVLREHRKRSLEERLQHGPGYEDWGLVFHRPDGRPCNPSVIYRRFKKLVRGAGVTDVNLHGLRHTHSTHLMMLGVPPRVVQERLGHSSVNLTLDTYSHVSSSLQGIASEKIRDLFWGREGGADQEKTHGKKSHSGDKR